MEDIDWVNSLGKGINMAKYGLCKKFEFKPSGILWEGEACDENEEEKGNKLA